jgi:penicillin-binding protein 1A
MNEVLGANARYGTGSGSGDGVHPNAGKTGTTEDHADAWYVGYTRGLSTAVWMGYPSGEIPMLSVHGQSVAGSTFPVPIWHNYMAAAEWQRPAREFLEPSHEITYRPLEHNYYGYTAYSAPEDTTTTETTETKATDSASSPASPTAEQLPKPTPAPKPAPAKPAPPSGPRPAE